TIDPGMTDFQRQMWRFDAHYVPADSDTGACPGVELEYWQLAINPMQLVIGDWRQLTDIKQSDDLDSSFYPFGGNFENLLTYRRNGIKGVHTVFIEEFRVLRREGYLFNCEFTGEIEAAAEDETEALAGEFRMLDEIPFASVTVRVPINATDPLASARAIAAREIGLAGVALADVRPYDPTRKFHSRSLG